MDRETLEENQFFLVYYGNGFTLGDVQQMTLPELYGRAQRLLKQKEQEKEAYDKAVAKAKRASKRRR